MTVEVIITGARVLTMDRKAPRAEAVAWSEGRIVAVGGAEVLALRGPETLVIEAGGRTLMPGFFESHLHLGLGGNELVCQFQRYRRGIAQKLKRKHLAADLRILGCDDR